MQTDEERKADGMDVDGAEIHPITWFRRDFDKSRYNATDDKFKPFHWYAIYKGMDTDRKVIFYMPEDTVLEFKYED